MFLSIFYIAVCRTEFRNAIILVSFYGEGVTAYGAIKNKALFTNLLMRSWLLNNFPAKVTWSWRYSWVWHSLRTKHMRIFFPENIIRRSMTGFAKCCQVVLGISVSHILKEPIRNDVVAIKIFPCTRHTTMLTNIVISLQNRPRYFWPILSPIRRFFHKLIIA